MGKEEQVLCQCGCGNHILKYDSRNRERFFSVGHNLKSFSTPFAKGVTPWNKGLKGIRLSPESEFKKGHIPSNKLAEGVTSQSRLERIRFGDTVRIRVLQRDNYTCQICQQYGGNLHVDHIKTWIEYPELRFDIDNCRTLCMACHYYVTFKRKIPNGVIWGNGLSRKAEL